MFESTEIANLDVGIVDPRMSAEAISACFLHCILKGLHNSPRVTRDGMIFQSAGVVTAEDVSCLVIPDGCVGLPTVAAMEQGIPVIAVRENRNRMRNRRACPGGAMIGHYKLPREGPFFASPRPPLPAAGGGTRTGRAGDAW